MNKCRFTVKLLATAAFTFAFASFAQGQATRTWVSGVGNDADPCSRTAPCRTYAGAINKTAAGGEISTLDPGGFGAVTISKSITIDGTNGAGFGSILACGSTGVNVNDSTSGSPGTIVVTLRRLSINGCGNTVSPGNNGVNFTSGKTLNIEDCYIFGFKASTSGNGNGVKVNLTATDKSFWIKNTIVHDCRTGVDVTTSSGFVVGVLDNVKIDNLSTTGSGIALKAGGFATVRDSTITRTGTGINITGGANSGVQVVRSTIHNNTTGIAVGGSTSRIHLSSVVGNSTGISLGVGGVMRTGCDNFIDGNSSDLSGGALTNACVR